MSLLSGFLIILTDHIFYHRISPTRCFFGAKHLDCRAYYREGHECRIGTPGTISLVHGMTRPYVCNDFCFIGHLMRSGVNRLGLPAGEASRS